MSTRIVRNSIEKNKYNVNSMTLHFFGRPTIKQVLLAAKSYALGCSVKPDFANPNLEVHFGTDGDFVRVQFSPNVSNTIR